MKIKQFRISAALAIIAVVSAAILACGSSDTAVVTPQDGADPVAAAIETTGSSEPAESQETQVSPASTTAESRATVLEPAESSSDTLVATNETAVVELTLVDDPAVLEALQSEADTEADTAADTTEAALLTLYSDYGFALKLDLGAEVQTGGWTEPEPSMTQGIIAFSYGGVNANLVWGPPEDRTALRFLADTYNILRASQPSVTFESISDGDVSISDQAGVYGGFKAIDNSGATIGGGLIGAWICGDSDTAFRMTLTGEDATVVQLRFDRLLENFACSSS